MSEQKWTVKEAQNLQKGNLISGISAKFALEVISVESEGENVLVKHYDNLYRSSTNTYVMRHGQLVPVAISGVSHMDIITNHFLQAE